MSIQNILVTTALIIIFSLHFYSATFNTRRHQSVVGLLHILTVKSRYLSVGDGREDFGEKDYPKEMSFESRFESVQFLESALRLYYHLFSVRQKESTLS